MVSAGSGHEVAPNLAKFKRGGTNQSRCLQNSSADWRDQKLHNISPKILNLNDSNVKIVANGSLNYGFIGK